MTGLKQEKKPMSMANKNQKPKGVLAMGNEKVLTKEDLTKRFEDLFKSKQAVEKELGQIQLVANQKSTQYQQIQGAMQDAGELLAQIVGVEEAQKIINEVQNPKQEQPKKEEKVEEPKK